MNATDHEINETGCSRALVALNAPQPRASLAPRRAAPFLAQLIATRAQAPQTRVNRRAEPAEAIARYRAMSGILKAAQ